ncbi:MAG: phospho-N-acetylmuramoyl-pentapeptide-transferase [Puniceicoccales bacterium]|jgi:phospho-N-acetylmuramoyl-pentapeptide-transferase|nr:phospho-N-acetylmuramoyl-pentapeptide-transferase [Puniceicoccales bacterium]
MAIAFPTLRLLISVSRQRGWRQIQRQAGEVRDLATLHAAKERTPTLGGLGIWLATCTATLLYAPLQADVVATLAIFSIFAAIGLADDGAKIFFHSSRGMAGKSRLICQGIAVLALFVCLSHWAPDSYHALHRPCIPLPFRSSEFHLTTFFAAIFSFLVLAGSANGVNLTDGIDGLAAGCSLLTAIALAAIALHGDAWPLSIPLLSLAGSLATFLWFNAHPAQIFMGDTGALAIGGLLGSAALFLRQPFLLAIIGGVFVLETVSVLLQVYYFKWTGGRRIFRMAPFHHHLELGGWPETRITVRLWLVTTVLATAGLLLNRW